jgi:hypothetical protein
MTLSQGCQHRELAVDDGFWIEMKKGRDSWWANLHLYACGKQ